MITFDKVYIGLSKNTHLSLHSLPSLINLKNTQISFIVYMKNYDYQEKQFQIYDPIQSHFKCITTCDLSDVRCISRCVEILKQNEN